VGRGGVIARLRLFARAREAAGRGVDDIPAESLGELLDRACDAYGEEFAAVLATAAVWINGEEPAAGRDTELGPGDEVAVLPPVSGGR
jgi:molybdopterin synthase sulfur carrier subunit